MAKISKVILGILVFVFFFIITRAIMKKQNPLVTLSETISELGQKITRGFRNNNPGNIRISSSAWLGKIPVEKNTDGSFEQFETAEKGIRALDKLLATYRKKGFKTIADIVTRFAPSNENDTRAYIKAVSKNTGYPKDVTYPDDVESRIKLVRAIIKQENGIDPYTDKTINEAIA